MSIPSIWIQRVVVIAAIASIGACGSTEPELPALPEISVDHPLDVVDAQIRGAQADVVADPGNAEKNGKLGMILSAYGHTELAQPLFKRAHALAPREFKWVYYQAATSHASGDATETVDYLERAIRLDPDYGPARLRLGDIYLQNDLLDEAEDALEGLQKELPDEPRVALILGRLAHKRGDLDNGRRLLEQAVEMAPASGEPVYALAQLMRDLGDENATISLLDQYDRLSANRLHASDPVLLEVSALNESDLPHLTRGAHFAGSGEIGPAIASYRAALDVNPVAKGAHAALIKLHAKIGEHETTESLYADALARELVDADILMAYAGARRVVGDTDTAITLLGDALALDPSRSVAWLAMAQMQEQRGEKNESIESYGRYLDLYPFDQRARWRIGALMTAVGDYDAAEGQLYEALAPGGYLKPDILRTLAKLAAAKGEHNAAREFLQEARTIAKGRSDVVLLSAIDKDLAGLKP